MTSRIPRPISESEERGRQQKIEAIARRMGFVGRVDYQHVRTHSGGAQFGLGTTIEADQLLVSDRAFDRDSDPNDFSLEAIIAHECGHQVLFRNSSIRARLPASFPLESEEVLASLIGSLLVTEIKDRDDLIMKAMFDELACGVPEEAAIPLAHDLRTVLERLL
jgi:hypothetical protein